MASNILPIFWNLASSSKDTRLNSSAELISSLEGFQKTYAEARESKEESSEDEDDDEEDEENDDDEKDDDAESGIEVDEDDEMDGEGNEAARTEAKELDKRLDKDNAADVVYAVKRLIRGLGSSRDSSRLGFAVALTELLSRISSVSPAQAISLLIRSSQTSKNNKGQENRDLLFARLFGITAVVNSGSLFTPTATIDDFRVVTGELVNLGRRKGWLRESAWWTLITAVEGLLGSSVTWSDEAVTEVVDKLYGREGEGGWSSEKVALTLVLEQKRPDLDWKSLLAPTFKHTPLMASANLVTLAPILKGSDVEDDEEDSGIASTGSWKPQPHFVWNTVLERYFSPSASSKQASFQDFFRVVVDESLFANSSSNERKYWGFSIILMSLPKLPSELLPQIFTPNFMRSWINHLSSQDRYLHKAALQTAQALQETVKSNPKVGFTLLSQLVGKHGRPDFDKVTKTKLVETIMGNLSTDGVDEYVVYLQGIIMGSQQDKNGVDAKVTQDRRHWALDQLLALCRNGSVPKSDTWVSSVLDFMLVHGFFNIRKTDKKSNLVALQSTPKPPLSEVTAAICRSRFFSCLLEITTATPPLNPSADASQPKRQQGCDSTGKLWLLRVLDTVTALEKDKKHVEPILDADDEIRQMRQSAFDTLTAISKLKKGDNAALARGTEVLLAFLILQTYDESEDALDLLEETQAAARRMFALDPTSSTSSPADAAPVDTMLDTLIALLDKGSSDLRNLANLVAGLISSAFTKSSIEHLNAQLESTVAESAEIDDDGEDDAAADGDDDEDMEDDNGESDDEVSESEDEDEEEDDTAVVDPAFRARVAAALQVSGMNVDETGGNDEDEDDDDESDEEVWDDEQMMKVDEQLAAVFREQRAGGATDKKAEKNLQTESIHFKARILDLYDVYAKKQPSNPLVIELVVPLLSIIKNSGNAAAALSNKASSVIRSRFNKVKELPLVSSAKEGQEVLTKIHDLARKTYSAEFTNLCTICSLFVARSIDTSAAVHVYSKTVDEYMTHKQTQLHANFLTEFFKRHPQRAWSLHSTILPYLAPGKAVNIYRQNVAYELISLFAPQLPAIHKSHAKEVDSMIPKTVDAFYATLDAASSDEAWKADRLRDFLKPVLAFARATRLVGYAWDLERFDKVREGIKDGRLGKFGSVNSLLSQIRSVVGKDSANGSGGKKDNKKRAANGDAKDQEREASSPVAPKKRKETKDKTATKPKKVKSKASKA